MNITLPTGGRVHWCRDGFPACGGGRHGKAGFWQLDIGSVSCKRCQRIHQTTLKKNHATAD